MKFRHLVLFDAKVFTSAQVFFSGFNVNIRSDTKMVVVTATLID